MANAADTSSKTKDTPASGEKKRRSPIVLTALVALVAAAAAGAGVWYYTNNLAPAGTHADRVALPPAPAQYLALDPAFVVNLPYSFDGPRYLQVEVQLMTRDPASLEKLKANIPAIRARLLMFFSQTDPAQIGDRAGLEKLQQSALEEVHALMKAETGNESADALLFTSFVTQ